MARRNPQLGNDIYVDGEVVKAASPDSFETETRRVNSEVTMRDMRRKGLARVYEAEPKETVIIAPMYAPYFGKCMHVSINGISTSVPCDGRPRQLPYTFACEVQSRLAAVNRQQARQKYLSDVGRNVERSPGDLPLF